MIENQLRLFLQREGSVKIDEVVATRSAAAVAKGAAGMSGGIVGVRSLWARKPF